MSENKIPAVVEKLLAPSKTAMEKILRPLEERKRVAAETAASEKKVG